MKLEVGHRKYESVLFVMYQSRIERETFGLSLGQMRQCASWHRVITSGAYYLHVISCINHIECIAESDPQKIYANCPESHANSFFLSEGHCFHCVTSPRYL